MLKVFSIFFLCAIFCACQRESQIDRATHEGILLIGNSAEPKSLDLQVVSGVLESNIIRSLFEGLVQFHPNEDLTTLPGVAISVTSDETFTEWHVILRQDAKWSDGMPVTSEDFRFSYERILTPSFGAKYAEMLYSLEGAESFNKGDTKDFTKVGIQVINSHEFRLKLRGSTPFFREILKHYTWYPVPKHQVLKYGKIDTKGNPWSRAENLVSNGPFQIKSHRRNDHIEVERNPHYWNSEKLSLNGIRFLPISNVFTEARMFRDKQLHITYTAAPEVVDLMKKKDPISLRQEPFLGTVMYRYNTQVEPLNDLRVRRALSLSIDRNALCRSVFRGFTPAYAITPPMDGYLPPRGVSFDPTEAKKILAEAGYPGGKSFPRLKILIASRETNVALATAIQAMWREHLGIDVEIENKEWTAYIVAMQNMDYQISSGGWIGDYIDPLTFLEMWMPSNGNNNTAWESQEYSRMIRETFLAKSPSHRFQLLYEAEKLLLEDSPVTPIAWWGKNYLIHPAVKGWSPLLLDNHPYTAVRLEPVVSKP